MNYQILDLKKVVWVTVSIQYRVVLGISKSNSKSTRHAYSFEMWFGYQILIERSYKSELDV